VLRNRSLNFENVSKTNETKARKDAVFNDELLPHADALYSFAYNLTYREEDARDLVQETFLKAYRFIDSYEQGTNAKAWLFKILKNAFINEYRKRSKQPSRVELEDTTGYHDQDEAGTTEFIDLRHELFQDMIGDEVMSALNSLPVDFRTVILLCDVEEFSYEEIARIVDIPIGTVRSRLHRARGMLQERLQEYAKAYGYK